MSLLLIGCGYWGRNWARTLHAMGELSAVCDGMLKEANKRQEVSALVPGVPLYDDFKTAIQHAGLKGAIVATPAATHAPLAMALMDAGIDVLVEKPLALDVNDARLLVDKAKETGRTLAVGHLLLYHPALQALKAHIDSGALGRVLSISCRRLNLGQIRNEENALWSLAPHDLSILDYLTGEPLTLQHADAGALLGRSGLADHYRARFSTPSGIEASIEVGWLHPYKTHETVVVGTHAMAVFEDTAQDPNQKLRIIPYRFQQEGDSIWGLEKDELQYIGLDTSRDLLTREAQAFIDATRQPQTMPNDGNNGLKVVNLLGAIEKRLQESAAKTPAGALQ